MCILDVFFPPVWKEQQAKKGQNLKSAWKKCTFFFFQYSVLHEASQKPQDRFEGWMNPAAETGQAAQQDCFQQMF